MAKKDEKLKNILVVDDLSSVRELVKDALTTDEWEVFEAENTTRARRLMKFVEFDLLLLDISMPRQSGLEFLRELRNEGINIPVIMFTSSGSREDVEEAVSLNISDYIKKPIGVDDLLKRVSRVLSK